jgi:hypothetical protein
MPNLELEEVLQSSAWRRFDIAVDLGNTSIRLISNCASFAGATFFSRSALLDARARVDHDLWCIDDPSGALRERIQCYHSTRTYRAACFEMGYYATDHFGAPIVLHRFANRHYLIGERLERVVWSYFVKFFIFIKSLEEQQLFLKASSVAFGPHGVLIVGRGSGGKTTFAQALCHNGANFVTNSHAVIDGLVLTGVRTTMRVRPSDKLAAPAKYTSTIQHGEVLIDPFESYVAPRENTVRLESLCIVDYRPGRDEGVSRIGPDEALGFLDQFAWGLNVYRLEEEMLEFFDHDLLQYGRAMQTLRSKLQSLVKVVPSYIVRTDVFDERKLGCVYDAIGWPRRKIS